MRDGREDRDRDGLSNAGEDQTGNDPTDKDTDDDGVKDGAEQAGVVASFDGETLVIDLANGTSVSGTVTEDTAISCESKDDAEDGHHASGKRGHASTWDEEDEWGDEPDGDVDPDEDVDEDLGDDESEDDESEEDGSDDSEEWDGDERPCTAADLLPGARVHEAEARLTADGLVFEEIELID